ncbi:MAG: hypothetical protein JSW64_05335 [Candidatus Zixiibacteriota bacterium]|nr:MAG: hypothetical protein JSW64_05335 [candidate division Zixibacteria bacterium]
MCNLKRLRLAVNLAGILLILFSCAKDPTEVERTPTSTFPLTTDSRWEYDAMWHTIPFNDSSLTDTVTREIFRHIIGPGSLPGIPDLIVCDDTVITYLEGDVDTFINRQWLKIEDDKLKMFAYDDFSIGSEPNPYIYDFPHNLLDFPLRGGKAWIAWIYDQYLENKNVVGIDYIELPSGWRYCDVIRSTIWNSTTNDTIRSAFEWYSNDGLMGIEYAYPTSILYDEFGAILDSIRSFENWELIDMEVMEP